MTTTYKRPAKVYVSAQERSAKYASKTQLRWSHLWAFVAMNGLWASIYLSGGAAPAPESARNCFLVGLGAGVLAWKTRAKPFDSTK